MIDFTFKGKDFKTKIGHFLLRRLAYLGADNGSASLQCIRNRTQHMASQGMGLIVGTVALDFFLINQLDVRSSDIKNQETFSMTEVLVDLFPIL